MELSLALRFDEAMEHAVQSEVRSINCLPLSVKGRILSEAILIYTKDEEKRVVFEKQVRTAYFDFLPVIRNYRQIYRQKLKTDSHHGIH